MEEKCLKVQNDEVFQNHDYNVNFDSCYSRNNYEISKVQLNDTSTKVDVFGDLQIQIREDLIYTIR